MRKGETNSILDPERSIAGAWTLFSLTILLILGISLLVVQILRRVRPYSCPSDVQTGGTGPTGATGGQTGSIDPCGPSACPIGPTGLPGVPGEQGVTGAQGETGQRGISIIVNAYGVLTIDILLAIQAASAVYPFTFEVLNDTRPDKTIPAQLSGDMTHHLVLWDPQTQTWHDQGPYEGIRGATGLSNFATGLPGPTGITGITGIAGVRGPGGTTGVQGPTGVSFRDPPTGGNRFGDGVDGDRLIDTSGEFLTQDVFYRTLNVTASGVLETRGFRIFASEWIRIDGLVHNDGQNGLEATNGTPSVPGGAGGGAGTFWGGGNGAPFSTGAGIVPGGPSSFAIATGIRNTLVTATLTGYYFSGGQAYGNGTDVLDVGLAGDVIQNSRQVSLNALYAAVNPLRSTGYPPGDPAGRILLSGGSGGAAPAFNSPSSPNTLKASGGGGGGVLSLVTPLLLGGGRVSAIGGKYGGGPTNGLPGGGGGGLVIVSTLINQSAIYFDVREGYGDLTLGGDPYKAGSGRPGLVLFL